MWLPLRASHFVLIAAFCFTFVDVSAGNTFDKKKYQEQIDEQLKHHKESLKSLDGVPLLEDIRDKIFENVKRRLNGLIEEYEAMAIRTVLERNATVQEDARIFANETAENVAQCTSDKINITLEGEDPLEVCKKEEAAKHGVNSLEELQEKMKERWMKEEEQKIRTMLEKSLQEDKKRIEQQLNFFKDDIKDIVINHGKEALYKKYKELEHKVVELFDDAKNAADEFGKTLNFESDSFWRLPTFIFLAATIAYNVGAVIIVAVLCTKCKQSKAKKNSEEESGEDSDEESESGASQETKTSKKANQKTAKTQKTQKTQKPQKTTGNTQRTEGKETKNPEKKPTGRSQKPRGSKKKPTKGQKTCQR